MKSPQISSKAMAFVESDCWWLPASFDGWSTGPYRCTGNSKAVLYWPWRVWLQANLWLNWYGFGERLVDLADGRLGLEKLFRGEGKVLIVSLLVKEDARMLTAFLKVKLDVGILTAWSNVEVAWIWMLDMAKDGTISRWYSSWAPARSCLFWRSICGTYLPSLHLLMIGKGEPRGTILDELFVLIWGAYLRRRSQQQICDVRMASKRCTFSPSFRIGYHMPCITCISGHSLAILWRVKRIRRRAVRFEPTHEGWWDIFRYVRRTRIRIDVVEDVGSGWCGMATSLHWLGLSSDYDIHYAWRTPETTGQMTSKIYLGWPFQPK